ncbi:MAG: cellulose synthase subunit BcsC-related outer membrane protein, partial [Candidatus Competibacter denitrificans]
DGRFFESSQQTGFSGGLKLQGVWRLAPQWQLGAAATYDRSPSFEQGGAYLFMRYLLEPRPAVFSSDLAAPVSWDGG